MRSSTACHAAVWLALSAGCTTWPAPEAADTSALARDTTGVIFTSIEVPELTYTGRPTAVRVGTITAPRGTTLTVHIDGVRGTSRDLSFPTAGRSEIVLEAILTDARGNRTIDTRRVGIEIVPYERVGCGLGSSGPYQVSCTLYEGEGPAVGASFEWDIGGRRSRAGSISPVVDLSELMDHERPSTTFPVAAVNLGTRARLEGQIVLGSHVYLGLKQDVVQPQVFPPVLEDACPLVEDFVVRNPLRREEVTFSRFSMRVHPCAPGEDNPSWTAEVGASELFSAASSTVTLPAGGSVRGQLELPCEDIPPGTCALEFDLVGSSSRGKHAQTSLWVHLDRVVSPSASPTTLATVGALISQGLVDPYVVNEEDLLALEASGVVTRTSAGWELR